MYDTGNINLANEKMPKTRVTENRWPMTVVYVNVVYVNVVPEYVL